MKHEHTISQITFMLIISTFLLIIIGGTVRITHSGLSCPDWPLCYGLWLLTPSKICLIESHISYNYNQIIYEWGHRFLAGSVVGSLCIILFCASLGKFVISKEKNYIYLFLSFLLIFLVVLQIFLGSLTVAEQNINWSVAAHLITALAFYSIIWLIYLYNNDKNNLTIFKIKPIFYFNILALHLIYLNMALGSMISASGVSFSSILNINNSSYFSSFFQVFLWVISESDDPFVHIYLYHLLIPFLLIIIQFISILWIRHYLKSLNINGIKSFKIVTYLIPLVTILNIIFGYYCATIEQLSHILIFGHQIFSLIIFTFYTYLTWTSLIKNL